MDNTIKSTIEDARADARRKFAEWLKNKYGLPKNYFGESITVDKLLAEFEEEQKKAGVENV